MAEARGRLERGVDRRPQGPSCQHLPFSRTTSQHGGPKMCS